jgi:hypothetical protein
MRIYHPYWRWEDYPAGFYNACSGEKKKELLQKVVDLFSNPDLTQEYMNRVVTEWKYSCEHNLTNESLNRIAYIGQAACCIYAGIPCTVTMEGWSLLTKEQQNKADSIAEKVLNNWKIENKNIQTCLSFI